MQYNDTPRTGQPAQVPDEEMIAHSLRLQALLTDEIRAAGGFLGFERFMELALYAPGLGYYSGGAQKLGRGGDFTTAPEVSELFGACVAAQCMDVLAELPGAAILEIGAGSGRLAVDILRRLELAGTAQPQYKILEVSADLRQRQQQYVQTHLPGAVDRVQWLDAPPDAPFDGVILANEVLDALPVARFRWRENGTEELGVVSTDGGFAWETRPARPDAADYCKKLARAAGWDDGYESEYCPRLSAWTETVTRALRRGAVLWFDYGLPRRQYYLAERHGGTLICHFRHRAHGDPFAHPGLQDITAWVDFTALAEASLACGFELAGFTTQAHFLAATGIDQEMRRIAGADDNAFARLANQARQLMLPGEMGERFKAMAWLRGLQLDLRGFQLVDLRHSL